MSELTHEVSAPRSGTATEWEVFASERTEPVRHVGSVTAPTRETAVEQAQELFAWSVDRLWLCPAGEMTRLTAEDRALEARRDTNA